MKGWILDVRPDHERDLMDIWIMDSSQGRTMLAHRFHPVMKAAGSLIKHEKKGKYNILLFLSTLVDIYVDLGGLY